MKFKVRANPEDVLYFLLFSIFLLYVVAVLTLNISYFASEGSFYGLNPIEAFSSERIATTLVFFFIFLIAIFFLVSSHFFDKEKGFGLSFSDAKDGFEKWAKDKEIKNARQIERIDTSQDKLEHAGMPLLTKDKNVWVDDGESHSLVIGATGSGKTSCIVNPLVTILAKKGESMIITDPKGEIYEKSGNFLRERGYKIVILNFRNPQNGDCWNPMTLPYELYKAGNKDKSNELIRDLGINILHEEKTDDPFWQNTAADFFTGLTQGLFQDSKIEEINLNSVISMLTVGEEKYKASNYTKEYFLLKDSNDPSYINAAGTINAPADTKGSIISVFRQKINIFAMAENLSEMLSKSSFDIMNIGKEKTAVFMIIHDEKKTYHTLATIFVKQCYESLIDVAQQNGGKLPIRTNFILDEFANMPPLKDVTTMITAARSRQIRFNLIIQNFAQLNQTYGKENAETIKGNCGNIIYLLSSELQSLEEISKLCGDKKVKKKDKEEIRPLISVAELQRLQFKDAIILRHRIRPFKTKIFFYEEYHWNLPKFEKATYPQREKQDISIFDLKHFVEEKTQNSDNAFKPKIEEFKMPKSLDNEYKPPVPFENETFNFNEIIKRIDEKISELEEEEINSQVQSEIVNPVIETENPNIEEIIKSIEEEKEDDYFDDFFDDE